jgi:hypothetical protein
MQEIAEEDEIFSAGEEDTIDSQDPEGKGRATNSSETSHLNTRKPCLAGCNSTSTDEEAMMFDLEEDSLGMLNAWHAMNI